MRSWKIRCVSLIFLQLAWAGWAQATCICTGYIEVNDTSTSSVLGYVSDTYNSFGEATTTSNPADRLLVTFNTSSSPFAITALNGPSVSFPYLGAIVGFSSTSDDLGAGSFNYLYLGGTVLTPSGSPPVSGGNTFSDATGIPENIESSIWSVSVGNTLNAQWINTDLSSPTTDPFYTEDTLGFTGDFTAFQAEFGPATPVSFTFVPEGGIQVPEPSSMAILGTAIGIFLSVLPVFWRVRLSLGFSQREDRRAAVIL
jgi:hypothetical protein